MLKRAVEAATLIGIVVAVVGGWFYALGTLAQLVYLKALGFDAHQFPPLGAGAISSTTVLGLVVLHPRLCHDDAAGDRKFKN